MQIRVLGPVELVLDGDVVRLGPPKQRALLALLALDAGTTVPVDRIVEGLWGDEDQPPTATKMVQLYVSQLRKLLADPAAITTHGRGYALHLDPAAVDAICFERLVAQAAASGDDDADEAARSALALWRGPPLADVIDAPFAAEHARRLEELHLVATELLLATELEAGRHAEVIGRLESLVARDPLRERPHALLMLALYRSGRQAEALVAFRAARKVLVEEAGLEPGPELRRLQEAVLRQDPALERTVPDPEWARRRTVEEVARTAESTARRRGQLREDEATLAAGLEDLQSLSPDRADAGQVCPFKGLAAFEATDAAYFFGRERLVAQLVARLVGTPLLALVGPSGSGKSSALRAGLLPALAGGALPGSESWHQVLLRPGDSPCRSLRLALGAPPDAVDPFAHVVGALPSGARLVVAVDQFEEVFVAGAGDEERVAFVDELVSACRRTDGRIVVAVALRADLYGACAAFPAFARLLAEGHVLVGPLTPGELARTIQAPAHQAGLEVERVLVQRLVDDVSGRPGALPLLSTALLGLWQERDGTRLTLASYERSSGVEGAVARLAERAYGALEGGDQDMARSLLLRLAGTGDGDSVVRRRVALDELETARDPQVRRVVEALAAGRLITLDGETAEIAHEALVREWPRLRGWLEVDADGRRLHRRLAADAREWDARGRDPSELYTGARLVAAVEWAEGPTGRPNERERHFLEQSRAASQSEVERARRANRRLRALLATAAVGLALAVGAGLTALDQRGDARATARTADAQRVGAQALREDDLDRSLLLARAGVTLVDSPVTRGNLLSTLLRSPPAAIGVLRVSDDDDAEYYAAAMSPDGRHLALGDAAGSVGIHDVTTRRRVATYALAAKPGSGVVQSLSFAPDGETLAVGGQEPNMGPDGAVVDLVDARTGRRRTRVALPKLPGEAPFVVVDVVTLPDGDVLSAQTSGDFERGPATIVRRIDGRTGRHDGRTLTIGRGSSFLLASGDRRRIFLSNRVEDLTREVDPVTLRVKQVHGAGSGVAAADRRGDVLVLEGEPGALRLLDLRSGALRRFRGRHHDPVNRVALTPDGRTAVASDAGGVVRTWDVATGKAREVFQGHRTDTYGLDVSRDGRTLVSASSDSRAILWDLEGDRRLVRRFSVGPPFPEIATPRGLAVAPDGRSMAVTRGDGGVELIDLARLQRSGGFRSLAGFALAVAFSPDGRTLAVTGERGRLRLHQARTGRPVADLRGMRATSQAVAFSPDGQALVAAEVDVPSPRLLRWDVRRRTSKAVSGTAASLAFSPGGEVVAGAALERGTEIRDAGNLRLMRRLALPDDGLSRSVAFSRDGRLLAVGTFGGEVHLYAADGWRPVGRPLQGHTQRVTHVAFSPGADVLSTASADGTARLWDVASGQPLGEPLRVRPDDDFVAAALTPDGAHLLAIPTVGAGVRLRVRPAEWRRHACFVAGRDLTPEEWRAALPEQDQRLVCERP